MKHTSWDESEVMAEYARLMTEKAEMVKEAQMAATPDATMPLSQEERQQLQAALNDLRVRPSNSKLMERWIARLQGQTEPQLQAAFNALKARHDLWQQGKDAREMAAVLLPNITAEPKNLAVKPASTEEGNVKTAEGKAYEVLPDTDIVNKAHPGKAMVNGDVVENLEQQQEADLAVARKSAKIKEVLGELYKMAKKLQAEGNDKAYQLVKETALEIAQELKK